jgi:hypothetical protein
MLLTLWIIKETLNRKSYPDFTCYFERNVPHSMEMNLNQAFRYCLSRNWILKALEDYISQHSGVSPKTFTINNGGENEL